MKNLAKQEIQKLNRSEMQKIMGGDISIDEAAFLELLTETGDFREDLDLSADLEIERSIANKLKVYALVNGSVIKAKMSWNGSPLLRIGL